MTGSSPQNQEYEVRRCVGTFIGRLLLQDRCVGHYGAFWSSNSFQKQLQLRKQLNILNENSY